MAERSPFRTFISFSHHDTELCKKLIAHLSTLVHDEGLIKLWWDRDLRDGEWDPEIMNQLDAADVILLLVSAEYIDSENCRKEYVRAMERYEALKKGADDTAIVVPVWLRDCDYGKAKFGKLNSLPAGNRSIDKWPNQDEAFRRVADELRDIVTQNKDRQGPRNNFMDPTFSAKPEAVNMLPHLCDRSELVVSLNQMFFGKEEAAGKIREERPFVFVIYGYEDDCPEGFKSRLEYRVLPKLFKVEGRILPIPLDWPSDGSSEEAAKNKFGWHVATRLDCEPAEIPNHLPAPVALFVSYFDYAQWQKSGQNALTGVLKFWDSFPDIKGKRVICCLIVRFPRANAAAAQSSGPGWLRKMLGKSEHAPNPAAILNCLATCSNVNGKGLELAPIKDIHVESWVDEPEVRAWCRPQSENEMRSDLRGEFSKAEEKPMGALVTPMQQALVKYKSTG